MEERSKTGLLVAVITWLIIGSLIAVAARKWIIPVFKQKERAQITTQTSSEGKYRQEVKLAADAFSGYCVVRSPEMTEKLKAQGIKLTVVDDKADYADRITKLQSGEIQMAVFTIDSLIKAGEKLDDFPASIVYVIDETKGADAMLAYTNAIASLADLNDRDARIVFTPDSPSEFLARIVIANFKLPLLPKTWWIAADGAAEVYKQLRSAAPGEKRAYVLWEPYVSKAREIPGVHVLVDSSRIRGFIVDVLVCRREFLVKEYGTAKAVVEAYARAAYVYNGSTDKMVDLVIQDARATGSEKLTRSLAEQIVRGIQWKNTVENYVHFRLVPESQAQGLEQLEDSVTKITGILASTGVIRDDPLKGKANTLFYDRILREMKADNFHPSRNVNLLSDQSLETNAAEQVRGEKQLAALTDEQWNKLIPVGELRVEPISFGRGTARINVNGERELSKLAAILQSWPRYYLLVTGQARPEGDPEANRLLARTRAEAAAELLADNGITRDRIKIKAGVAVQGNGEAQSVLFVLCEHPY